MRGAARLLGWAALAAILAAGVAVVTMNNDLLRLGAPIDSQPATVAETPAPSAPLLRPRFRLRCRHRHGAKPVTRASP